MHDWYFHTLTDQLNARTIDRCNHHRGLATKEDETKPGQGQGGEEKDETEPTTGGGVARHNIVR